MLVHAGLPPPLPPHPNIKLAGTHLYTWVSYYESLAQARNTVPARGRGGGVVIAVYMTGGSDRTSLQTLKNT